ncbi:MAG: amidohydrolase family protein [Planctomycetota bacterium]
MKNPSPLARDFLEKGMGAVFPVIDMHSHPDRFKAIYFPCVEPEDMAAHLDRAGVALVCGVTHESLFGDMRQGNDAMEKLVRAYPRHFRGYVGINPNFPDLVANELAAYERRRGFIGFKFLPSYHSYKITGPANVPVFEFAESRGLVILSHTWGHDPYNAPEMFADLAERYGNVTWLLGHAGYGDWNTAARIAADHPNVFLELTAAYGVNGVIERFVEIAGSRKVVFGTDWPWFDPNYGVGCVLFAHITDEDRRNILLENARGILRRVGVDLEQRDRL